MDKIIIDGYGLAFRSHYAHNTLQTFKGLYSGCVFGFLVGMRGLKKRNPHCHITVAWDSNSTRRKKIYAGYKANRPGMMFGEQIADLKRIIYTLNVAQVEYQGEEADDVIASFATQFKGEDGLIYIYSADKDLLQLVDDGKVLMIRPSSGKHQEKFFDEELVKSEYHITPKEMKGFLALRGDTADNIPGAFRIRSALLIDLLRKYGDPIEIFDHLCEEKLTDYENTTLAAFREQAVINLKLVALREDLELKIIDGIPNMEKLSEYLDKYEIKSIKPQNFIDVFTDMPAHMKKGPAVQSYSLFEE